MADSKSKAESRRTRDHGEECYTAEEDHSHPSTFTPSPSFYYSSSSPSSHETELATTVLSKKAEQGDGDEEEGYHTPTSPRHRIPEAVDCPPAPKKPACGGQKRKRSGRPVCWIHNTDLELMCFFMEAEDLRPMRKKVRRRE